MRAPIKAAIVVTVLLASACSSADNASTPTSVPPTSFATTTTGTTTTATATTTTTIAATTTTRATDAPPGQVTGVIARTGGGSGEVVITWTQNPEPDVVSYTISRAATSGGASVQIGTMTRSQVIDFPVAPYVDVPVRVGYYRIRAVDAGGNQGPQSVEVCGASPGNRC